MYFEFAGSNLVDKSIIYQIEKLLKSTTFINPHSKTTTPYIDEFRTQILNLCNTSKDEYTPIITSNATSALQLMYNIIDIKHIYYTRSNHNSVLGLRQLARQDNLNISLIEFNKERTTYSIKDIYEVKQQNSTQNLTIFPAECNFSGELYDLNWIERFQKELNCWVCLDAAKYISTKQLDLTRYQPEFVPISIYKIIGYPTGLGILLIKNNILDKLTKTYFGGGTIDFNLVDQLTTIPRKNSIEKLEDGTLPFISIAEASLLLKHFKYETDEIYELTNYAEKKARSLKHQNGQPLFEIYRRENIQYGSILTCNIKNQDGIYIGYTDVERLASLNDIQLRVGCFCNPGACSDYLNISSEEILINYREGHSCSNHKDIIHNKPTGAIRLSFGRFNTKQEIDKLMEWFDKIFIVKFKNQHLRQDINQLKILKFIVYPVKSCPGMEVKSSKITEIGFQYDRLFAIYDKSGKILNLQRNMRLSGLYPEIDFINKTMWLRYDEDQVMIDIDKWENHKQDNIVNDWLSHVLQQEVKLIKQEDIHSNFSNTSPFLIINEQSMIDLNMRIMDKNSWSKYLPFEWMKKEWMKYGYGIIKEDRFRPNIVIDGIQPYLEDQIKYLKIGNVEFISERDCSRCYTTTVQTEKRSRDPNLEPMSTLLTYRKKQDGIMFGKLFYLQKQNEEQSISISDPIELEIN